MAPMSLVPDFSEASDQELVAWTRQGRMEAFDQLVRRYHRLVCKLIYRLVRDSALTADLTQDTFIRAFRALDRYRPDFKFSSWIFKIANNHTCNYLKRRREQGIQRLRGRSRRCAELHFLDELSYSHIADILGVPSPAG